uniref:Conjugal transfer protein n=1 Tax=Rhabditophanes sp. KR3021 TaxID=114890 RepID=A0AC35TR04_9BILA
MGNKPAIKVAGVGPAYAQKLGNAGMPNASQLFGKYLCEGQNKGQFAQNLKTDYKMDSRNASRAAETMNDYAKHHF